MAAWWSRFPKPTMKWALFGSLGLNLALVGLLVGDWMHAPPSPPPPGLLQYARVLPDPYRRDLVHALRKSRQDWAGTREALRGQRTALAQALVAEPYDPARVAEVLAREPSLLDDLAERGTRLLLSQIERMDAADRARFAEALRRDHDGPGSGRGKGH